MAAVFEKKAGYLLVERWCLGDPPAADGGAELTSAKKCNVGARKETALWSKTNVGRYTAKHLVISAGAGLGNC